MAEARWLFPAPGGPKIRQLAPWVSHASPAASALTWALEIVGTALKSKEARLLPGSRGDIRRLAHGGSECRSTPRGRRTPPSDPGKRCRSAARPRRARRGPPDPHGSATGRRECPQKLWKTLLTKRHAERVGQQNQCAFPFCPKNGQIRQVIDLKEKMKSQVSRKLHAQKNRRTRNALRPMWPDCDRVPAGGVGDKRKFGWWVIVCPEVIGRILVIIVE